MFRSSREKSLSSRRALNRGKGCGLAFLILFFTLWNGFIAFACWAFFSGDFADENLPPWGALFLLPFAAVGIFGIVLIVRAIRGSRDGEESEGDSAGMDTRTSALGSNRSDRSRAPLVMHAKGRVGMAIGMFLFALVWNGVIGIFLAKDGFILFLTPFMLVGAGTIIGFLYLLLGSMNPSPTLQIDSHPLLPGTVCNVDFEVDGAVHRFVSLEFKLEGEESATYRRGTDRHTATNLFHEQSLALLQQEGDNLRSGSFSFLIPDDVLPSFKAHNNEIVWRIRVCGDIKRWPDVNDKFVVTVLGRPIANTNSPEERNA